MTVTEKLALEFNLIVNSHLIELEADVTPHNRLQIVKTWLEDYEDVPPRNPAEKAVHDALELIRERLEGQVKLITTKSA